MENTKLLTESTDQNYDISKEDIYTYAQQIGIDISKEKHLMWIAEKGLSEKVPKPWLILSDKKERIFYYNPETEEKSWSHPLDKEYAALVSEERSKSKSLNSASTDYGFESKLSSLADAPPLSSSGKNSPSPLKRGKNDGGLSAKKFEFGHIENRRGTQLAPVRLNSLKMPPSTAAKSGIGMSFMPKGATLPKKRFKEETTDDDDQIQDGLHYEYNADESNESLNSDEGSKYSYEASDDEEKHSHGLEPFDMVDASQLSPIHSADESPDALEINSLVQLGTKAPSKLDSSLKREKLENIKTREISPSLSLRKVGQPTFLRPLTQTTKKKTVNKASKTSKKTKSKYSNESEAFYDDKISATNEEQRLMLETLQKEWLAMQDEVEKQEKEKYEEMLKDSSKKLVEEEVKLRNENSERIAKIKNELQKKIEDEESAAEKRLKELQESNKDKILEEEKRLQKDLEVSSASLKDEIKKMEEKNTSELAIKKKELEEIFQKEIDEMKVVFDSKKKSVEETHGDEISVLEKLHKQKIEEMKNAFEKEISEVKEKVSDSSPKLSEQQMKLEELKKSVKDEGEMYQDLLKEKEDIVKEIKSEKDSIENLKRETSEKQGTLEEMHDEIDKTENELDALRLEKSALISELNILKENIKNEKSNLEKKSSSSSSKPIDMKLFSDSGINTYSSFFDTICTAVQVSQSYCDVSSQVDSGFSFMSDAVCQTVGQPIVCNKSCQTDSEVSFLTDASALKFNSEKTNTGSASDKALENALSDLSVKMDSRINVIENHIRSLQENVFKSAAAQTVNSHQEYAENHFNNVKTVPSSEDRIPPVYFTDTSIPPGVVSNPLSSQMKCRCELGDSASCDVLQEVKNSVYRLNEILCANYVPPLRFNSLYEVSQPVNNYSSPFDNFYTEFRQMQEKHRLTELKHKCENGAAKFSSGTSLNKRDDKTLSFTHGHWKSSHHVNNPNIYSHTVSDDPLLRAKNIVLREQARTWKEQQTLNSYVPHILPLNSTSESSQSSTATAALPSLHNVPSSQETFFHFEVDPEADYQMWMTRLNALQLRIRSHKLS